MCYFIDLMSSVLYYNAESSRNKENPLNEFVCPNYWPILYLWLANIGQALKTTRMEVQHLIILTLKKSGCMNVLSKIYGSDCTKERPEGHQNHYASSSRDHEYSQQVSKLPGSFQDVLLWVKVDSLTDIPSY